MTTYTAVTEDARVRIIDAKIRDRWDKAKQCVLTIRAWAQGEDIDASPVVISDEHAALLTEIDDLLDDRHQATHPDLP